MIGKEIKKDIEFLKKHTLQPKLFILHIELKHILIQNHGWILK